MTHYARLLTILFLLFIGVGTAMASDDPIFVYTDEEVEARLKELANPLVEPKLTPAVKSYLNTYFVKKRDKAERILGRSVLYFPLYEQKLAERNMPEALKYLSVVESALNPRAVSRSGAVGLWQFMPATATEYGMNITHEVDERCHPEIATDAALDYLENAYARFNDWSLALAAYNSGGGRVNRAIKRARSRNFWRIQRYLPRETRNYVPAFIAASYLMEYHAVHGLQPEVPRLDLQLTGTMTLPSGMSFYRIAQITGVPTPVIAELNPHFQQATVTPMRGRMEIRLPKRALRAMQDYLDFVATNGHPPLEKPVRYTYDKPDEELYTVHTYTLSKQETFWEAARKLQISWQMLRSWNVDKPFPQAGDEIQYFVPAEVPRFELSPRQEELPDLPDLNLEVTPATAPVATIDVATTQPTTTYERDGGVWYLVKSEERLADIAERFPIVSTKQLASLNDLRPKKVLRPGTEILLWQK